MARDTVAEIKHRLSLQDVVAPYVKLRKAGRSMVGLCPFHKEKTGSFHVSPERGTYHCFGCGEGGDAFAFIEKIEGVDFKGALKILAEKAGVEVVYDPKAHENASRTERLREVMARAVDFFVSHLNDGEAHDYAKKRGLREATIKEWQLGYAPDDWRVLLTTLTDKGFSVEELLAAGLIKEADGKSGTYYDRFRNRLMFPIRDAAGRTVAFTGRALAKDEQAKYLNSPETELYHKSEILFGLDKAKEAIRTRGFALLVEGQMDLVHAHQAGFTNTVALSGTAFTPHHARLLKRFSENLMLALDADAAGLAATQKSALVALAADMRVKVVRLVGGKDPADVLTETPKAFTTFVKEARPVVDFFLTLLGEREPSPHRLILLVEQVVLPLIRAIGSPMEQAHFIETTARTLGISAEHVRASVAKVSPTAAVKEPLAVREARKSGNEAREEQLRAIVALYATSPLAKRVREEYARITEAALPEDPPPEAALFGVEAVFGDDPPEGAADELLHTFEAGHVRTLYQEAVAALRKAEREGDNTLVKRAEARAAKVGKRLASLS